ncbi:MAG: hypothetical protein EP317_02640 [Bacillota bacterium]|nr:MAG: hypothetical protein EP317_02640 [Bacillota bacterium]
MSLFELKAYVDQEIKDQNNSHGFRAQSSFMMLQDVDLMIEKYLIEDPKEKGSILLNVFGLLQGLFVAIDALYDLAIGLTQYKYHINININPTLHELKYIRNDIVGHPTHRTYPDGGIGFSLIDQDSISKEKLSYKTYIYEKNRLDIRKKDVMFRPLLEAYRQEKEMILSDILRYLKHETTETDIPENIYTLFETLNLDLLIKIQDLFKKEYALEEQSSHRFMWRSDLLKLLINWEEKDSDLQEIILYMSKQQVSKMYEIALNMENRKGKDLYAPIPKLLHAFYKFMRKNEKDALELIENLHDMNDPFFQRNLLALMVLNPSKDALKLIQFLKAQTNPHKIFLIGSILRAYRPKN